jgi:hypothetical protein
MKMKAWIKRHKVITAFICNILLVLLIGVIEPDLAGMLSEVSGIGWAIYGFAWLIWEYPKRKRKTKTDENSSIPNQH